MGAKPGGNYAPIVRGMVRQVLNDPEYKEEIRAKIIAQLIDDPVRTLKDLSWLIPKELALDVGSAATLDTSKLSPEMLREVFSGQGTDESPAGSVQGSDTVATPARAAVRSISQPG